MARVPRDGMTRGHDLPHLVTVTGEPRYSRHGTYLPRRFRSRTGNLGAQQPNFLADYVYDMAPRSPFIRVHIGLLVVGASGLDVQCL